MTDEELVRYGATAVRRPMVLPSSSKATSWRSSSVTAISAESAITTQRAAAINAVLSMGLCLRLVTGVASTLSGDAPNIVSVR